MLEKLYPLSEAFKLAIWMYFRVDGSKQSASKILKSTLSNPNRHDRIVRLNQSQTQKNRK